MTRDLLRTKGSLPLCSGSFSCGKSLFGGSVFLGDVTGMFRVAQHMVRIRGPSSHEAKRGSARMLTR